MKVRILQWVGGGAISLLLMGGCASPRPPAPPERPAGELVVAMQGTALFRDGTLRAEASVSRLVAGRRPDGAGGVGPGPRGGGRHRGGDSGGTDGERAERRGRGLPRLAGAALTLRVKFENLSTEPIEVQILDVSSELGSFAVRPERLLVAPGQTSEVDPMVSQLGVVAAELPVTVVVRTAGKTETQVLRVKAVPPERSPRS